MPTKGQPSPQLGGGVRSRTSLPTHPYKAYGIYWVSQKAFEEWRDRRSEERKALRKANPKPRIPKGRSSKYPHPNYPYAKEGRFWRSEDEYRKYAREGALRRAADHAGLSIDEYLEIKRKTANAVKNSTRRRKFLQAELDRLREKYNLPRDANRTHLQAIYVKTRDPDIAAFLRLQTTATLTDTEKVRRIKKLFLEGKHTPLDLLYEAALIVGIVMRSK